MNAVTKEEKKDLNSSPVRVLMEQERSEETCLEIKCEACLKII